MNTHNIFIADIEANWFNTTEELINFVLMNTGYNGLVNGNTVEFDSFRIKVLESNMLEIYSKFPIMTMSVQADYLESILYKLKQIRESQTLEEPPVQLDYDNDELYINSSEAAAIKKRNEQTIIEDYECAGEQMRRLRAYNKKYDDETDEQYNERLNNYASIENKDDPVDTWVQVVSMNLDWFETAAEYFEFLESTLNRWIMPTVINKPYAVCYMEGFAIKVVPAIMNVECVSSIHEITILSRGKIIDSMVLEILECLRVQAHSKNELSEDDAFALIDVELEDMSEYQVQMYSYSIGQDCRNEIKHWAQTHSGIIDNLKRVSYGTFNHCIMNVNMKNLNNICGAQFNHSKFAHRCVLENVTFVNCAFINVEFDCIMNGVKFENCQLISVDWPRRSCNIQILNEELNLEQEEIEYDDA